MIDVTCCTTRDDVGGDTAIGSSRDLVIAKDTSFQMNNLMTGYSRVEVSLERAVIIMHKSCHPPMPRTPYFSIHIVKHASAV